MCTKLLHSLPYNSESIIERLQSHQYVLIDVNYTHFIESENVFF